MRLNLGCGEDVREGYVNVDARATHPSVQIVDLSKFPWPFPDQSADEILMLDFLEHFPYAVTQTILLECYRILKPDGSVTVQVPDALHTARAMVQEGVYLCNRCGGDMSSYGYEKCRKCGQTRDEISEAATKRFYGGQDYPGNFHQTAFTERSLLSKAKLAGLWASDRQATPEEIDHLWRNWTISLTLKKGDLW